MNEQCGMGIEQGKDGHIHHGCSTKSFSWSAVVAGAFVGMGLTFLLNLFSVAIGLSAYSADKEGMVTLAVGGLVGMAIGIVAVMYTAGYAAGYLGRACCAKRNLGALYGFTAWCMALILTALIASQLGHYISSYSSFVSQPRTVVITSDTTAPAVSMQNSNNTNANSNDTVAVNAEKAANSMGFGAFIIFLLFFLGAFSSAFGGHCGMTCRDDCGSKYR